MRIVEKALCILAVIGYIFLVLFWKGGAPIIAVSLLVLSFLYLFFSFALLNGIKLRAIFRKDSYTNIPSLHIVGAALTGYVFFQTCMGLIFGTLIWTGYKIFLIMGFALCFIVLVVSAAYRNRDRVYYKRILTRVIPLLSICLFLLLFSPRSFFLEMRYRSHPALIEAQEQSWKDPSNRGLRNKASDEWRKIYPN